MIVKMLRNPSKTLGCSLMENQTGEVDPALGSNLVALKIAVDVTPVELPKAVEAVPEEPAVIGVTESAAEPVPAPKKRSS